MAMLFVDGAIHKVSDPDVDPVIREGGVGVVLVSQRCTKGSIVVAGKYFPPSKKVTNQRMEIEAIRFGLEYVRSLGLDQIEPLYLWSDSMYALNTLGPSDWSPTKNLDLIVPIQRLIRSFGRVEMRHARSHIEQKSSGKLPDFIFHEMADVAASAVVKAQRHTQHVVRRESLDPGCISCTKFSCWQQTDPLKTMKVEPGGERCPHHEPWIDWAVKGFAEKEVEARWQAQKK